MSASISRTRCISVMPSMPGMRMSVMTTPVKPWRDEVERMFGAGEIARPQAREVERLRGRAAQLLLVIDQQHALAGFIRRPPRAAVGDVELDAEDRAAFGMVRDGQAAAEILDDVVGDREAKAEPLADALGGEEGIEDALGESPPATPGPWSRTVMADLARRCWRAETRCAGRRRPSTASAALEIRLTSTCCSRTEPARTISGSAAEIDIDRRHRPPSAGRRRFPACRAPPHPAPPAPSFWFGLRAKLRRCRLIEAMRSTRPEMRETLSRASSTRSRSISIAALSA